MNKQRVEVGSEYKLSKTGQAWGTVDAIDEEISLVSVSLSNGCKRDFGLWEVAGWLRDGVLTDDRHFCLQCNQDMGFEYILGPVCGKCVRKNHKKATKS